METVVIKVKHLSHCKDLPLPSYATAGASGVDLYACVDKPIKLKPFERALIPTGIQVEIPKGYEAQIRPRSGLALKYGVTVLNTPGTIDSDYRGEVCVILINLGNADFVVEQGMRIAQMVICPVVKVNILKVNELSATERGEGGFGSTGR